MSSIGQASLRAAANIRALRNSRKMSFEDLADKAGMSAATMWRTEAGQRNINVDEVAAIAEVFGVEPGDLAFSKFALTVIDDYDADMDDDDPRVHVIPQRS